MAEALAATTPEEFLAGESVSQQRHEFVTGRVYALAGGWARHNALALLIYELIGPRARARGCRTHAFDRLLRTRNGNFYYPDLMVLCAPPTRDPYDTDPTMIVEVLSPSTHHSDRREKASLYAESPTLELLLLADQNIRRIEVARLREGRTRGGRPTARADSSRHRTGTSRSTPSTISSTRSPHWTELGGAHGPPITSDRRGAS